CCCALVAALSSLFSCCPICSLLITALLLSYTCHCSPIVTFLLLPSLPSHCCFLTATFSSPCSHCCAITLIVALPFPCSHHCTLITIISSSHSCCCLCCPSIAALTHCTHITAISLLHSCRCPLSCLFLFCLSFSLLNPFFSVILLSSAPLFPYPPYYSKLLISPPSPAFSCSPLSPSTLSLSSPHYFSTLFLSLLLFFFSYFSFSSCPLFYFFLLQLFLLSFTLLFDSPITLFFLPLTFSSLFSSFTLSLLTFSFF